MQHRSSEGRCSVTVGRFTPLLVLAAVEAQSSPFRYGWRMLASENPSVGGEGGGMDAANLLKPALARHSAGSKAGLQNQHQVQNLA